MTRAFLKKYWLILTSLGCISTAITLACAGDYGNEYGTSNFTPELFVDTAYSPFFYSVQFYYGIGHDENHITRWNDRNVQDWSDYLGKSVAAGQLAYFLNTAEVTSIDSALANPGKDKKLTAFFRYLRLAKTCENFSLTPISHWEEDKKPQKTYDAAALNRQLQAGLTAAADPFLQERYWFQLVRSNFFNGSPRDVIKVYDDYSSKFPANKLFFRSLAYSAGAYCKLKQFSKANYYYSRVYDSCDELKTVAHYSFHPQDESDWRGTLALCRNKGEQAALWQMLGIFYSDPQRAISEIYQLDPKSGKLDLLLSRAINESEQRFSHNEWGSPELSDSLNKALRPLVTRIADAGNTDKPWIWFLAAGYLNMLDKHYPAAFSFYDKAQRVTPHDRLPQAQLRLLRLINTIASVRAIDGPLEQKLEPELNWLVSQTAPDASFRHEDALAWIKRTMAEKYKLTGDKVRSECFFSRAAFYMDNKNVEALKAFLTKSNKTPYEQLLCTSFSKTKLADIFEYQAIQLAMTDHFDEAVAAMKQAGDGAKTILPGNPFNARINDCHDCDHEAAQKIKYTKAGLLLKLKEMKEKIAAGQDIYTNATLIANAEYNMTWYGNARAFYECRIIGSDGWWSIDSVYEAPLTAMTIATKYYTQALSAAVNDEQKVKCQYLLAKCQRNAWYNHNFNVRDAWPKDDKPKPDFVAWDGFKALKQYANTKYYQEVLHECGYFNTYISKKH